MHTYWHAAQSSR